MWPRGNERFVTLMNITLPSERYIPCQSLLGPRRRRLSSRTLTFAPTKTRVEPCWGFDLFYHTCVFGNRASAASSPNGIDLFCWFRSHVTWFKENPLFESDCIKLSLEAAQSCYRLKLETRPLRLTVRFAVSCSTTSQVSVTCEKSPLRSLAVSLSLSVRTVPSPLQSDLWNRYQIACGLTLREDPWRYKKLHWIINPFDCRKPAWIRSGGRRSRTRHFPSVWADRRDTLGRRLDGKDNENWINDWVSPEGVTEPVSRDVLRSP